MTARGDNITTVSLMRYSSLASRWWFFVQMGLGVKRWQGQVGIQFIKLLGTGAGNGFSIWPNWGVYGLLVVWDNEACARSFFAHDSWWAEASRYSEEHYTVYLRNSAAHGQWGGVAPFSAVMPFDVSAPVAVLTRATLHPRHLWRFWQHVPRVSNAVKDRPGELLSIGIGEFPVFLQATFSLWENGKQMLDYAYNSSFHRVVVRRAQEAGWFREELFARFVPYASHGTWQGKDPVAALVAH